MFNYIFFTFTLILQADPVQRLKSWVWLYQSLAKYSTISCFLTVSILQTGADMVWSIVDRYATLECSVYFVFVTKSVCFLSFE